MRNANAQRARIMVRDRGLQQPPTSHVSHAETEGCHISKSPALGFKKNTSLKIRWISVRKFCRTGDSSNEAYEGQRCALLTTKSRNTCTRATVFNSSG
jgi:hypothetical protein